MMNGEGIKMVGFDQKVFGDLHLIAWKKYFLEDVQRKVKYLDDTGFFFFLTRKTQSKFSVTYCYKIKKLKNN